MGRDKLRNSLFYLPPLLAFGIFLVYLGQVHKLAFFKYLVANPLVYDSEAKQILVGVPPDQPFFLSALYPALVALGYGLFHANQTVTLVVQGLALALNVYVVGLISRRLFSAWTALAASAGVAFYWSFYYFAGELVPATIFVTFLLLGTLLFLDRMSSRPSPAAFGAIALGCLLTFVYATPGLRQLGGLLAGHRLLHPARQYWAGIILFLVLALGSLAWLLGERFLRPLRGARNLAASGMALGLGTLAWSGATAFAGLLAIMLVAKRGSRARALVFAAGFLVPVLSSLTYNYLVSSDLIPVTSSLGVNLFIGNNATSDGMDPFRFGEGNRVRIEADRLRLSGKQRSDFFAAEALGFIRGNPGRWLQLEGRKLLISLSRVPINNNADIAERRTAWKRFFMPVLHFGIIFPLAAAGLASAIRENRRALILAVGYASFLAIPLVFFTCERFRLPAIALLIPLAAYGAEMLVRYAASGAYLRLGVSVLLLVAAALVSNIDFLGLAKYEMPGIVANKAYVARLAGDLDQAESLSLHALSLDPHTAGAHFQLGAIADQRGDHAQAFTHYLDCLQADPYFTAAYGAAAQLIDAARISRSYLDAYVDDLVSGADYSRNKGMLVDAARRRGL